MKPLSGMPILARVSIFFLLFQIGNNLSAQTFTSLWNEYVSNPYNHPNIPNNSYAGYGTGTVPLPNPAYSVYDVTLAPYNAVVNDGVDDQPAIQAAIDAAGTAGSGIIYLPAGTYTLLKPIYIKHNNIIVRGAGSTGGSATILDFRFSMYSMYKADIDASGKEGWLWWSTGLIWIGPADTFKPNGAPDMIDDFEQWRSTTTLATVTATSNPGTFSITVDNTASLSTGMKVLLRYQMPSNRSLIKHIHGHSPTEAGIDVDANVGNCTNITSPTEPYYYWPASIQGISGNVVTFDRPLRIKVDPALWPATLRNISSMVTESGIEDVQIKGYNTTSMAHLPAPTSTSTSGTATLGGWNGIYINRSWNCWADNIRFVNLECGVVFAAAKNCSALNTFVTSAATTSPVTSAPVHWYHHPYALRVFSSDNLIQNFTIDGPSSVRHGINAEWYSSGNVYSKGLMKVGTFDSHRASAFDQIRTEITVANDAASAPGGATTSGPFAGKRFAHWNIVQQIQGGYTYQNGSSRNGNDVYEPRQFPMGALVAITGTRDGSDGEFVPPGNLGAVEAAGAITDPALINLYEAELALRMGGTLPIHLMAFNAIKSSNDKSFISWVVNEPDLGDRFVLQWSTDGINFTDIHSQIAEINRTNYEYLHLVNDWSKDQYYRLKIITYNNSTIYSPVKKLNASNDHSLLLYPNPAVDKLKILFENTSAGRIQTVKIYNSSSQLIKEINPVIPPGERIMTIDVFALLPATYYAEIITENGLVRKSFIKH